MERTLSIVKPDGVGKNLIGKVIKRFEKNGLRIAALKMLKLSKDDAKGFYIVHKERPFYESLTSFMSEGPIVVMVVEGENAINKVRESMGATNPKDAAPGTIRADFASDIEHNIVHGSDSKESASYEIPFFFSSLEIQ
ncbi:MAG: nucleoside-diphosphate kinase [Nitrospirae bacterium CG_4_10_14_0_8_um_filter_41_23]|nr:nucleoside-diphosphate kinase [Nitrospirota bacterium]OIP59000.1 MAG: nucleoside-diphosphate kinase [Nitrospirae bacterium CG2_30_41_42]PIQ93757.1 MAG: nucleoside-diphosphate kinase [Nitrospirae bacterium CG11_big_fil_rev_8_21_14_0_20_41_14]PIV43499.1 MAG: nucleoside-diphosphate kinase [Nitrospirae bacterium CG02_land_8_20_14_3_00_41_53]PIW88171.1 MAG: nucleoside-diphosphate kinase [Nitrospirae bacterium CG_4_8_14_3_um_filter_41_47]PIY86505.1 MAG: nucleoside-diphosphate kinase [Nitrospirae 